MTHDYDAMTRAIKDAPLTKQLQIIREIVSAKDFGDFTCDATNAIDFALDDLEAQAVDMGDEAVGEAYTADLFRAAPYHGWPL